MYGTGRSTRENRSARGRKKIAPFDLDSRPETIEETAEMVTTRGGVGVAVQFDHTVLEWGEWKNVEERFYAYWQRPPVETS